ncbi:MULTISPECIES: hypothetical protein [unclassified Paenibacillus]|uniref:putative amidoligase domain-containing protein n=1 Tax=unclassified Paenibacillus TaxID=185978 RepID=UPI000899BE93|nr:MULTISPECIES: hypothetical protein [unclassified Paenibacillus]OMC68458.1 hypothetical protein BK126_11515 [Paenibacillus sp. FSL H7-0326]SDW61414.1 Phage phiEco32-like COOH.NH2 ligase-type 2 [Paenibacillus sp. PDC88]
MLVIRNSEHYESMTMEEREARLTRSGLRSSLIHPKENKLQFLVTYEVLISQLHALRIVKKSYTGIREGNRTVLHREDNISLYNRIERAAVRAAYALNLEHAEVVLQAGGQQGISVSSVHSQPWLIREGIAELYEQAMMEKQLALEAERNLHTSPVLGMDPEFLLISQQEERVVPASLFLERTGEAGCDAVTRGGRRSYPVAELRPMPSSEPRELLAHLMHAFLTASTLITDHTLLWRAGGLPVSGLPLGGHVHFSRVVLTYDLLRALDNYLALPIAILEDPRSSGRRPKYGYLGDFRTQPYGGFEYRTLPSFLVSPMIAKGVVSIAYLVAANYRLLQRRPLDLTENHEAFYKGNKQVLRGLVHPLLQELTALPDYNRHHKYVNPLITALYQGKTWDESKDIRPLWNIQQKP